jgi:hypothetical protein
LTPRLAPPLAVALASVVVVALAAPAARSDEAAARCLEAHEQGQRARKAGRLLAAREALVACAAAACPGLVRADCARWGDEVDVELPTIVLDVVDRAGRPLGDARVLVDGAASSARLDGRPLALDPGSHVVRVERGDGSAAGVATLVLPTGVKNRLVPLVLDDPAAPRPAIARTAVAIAFGGVAAVALANFAYFAATGQRGYDDLRARCAPRCDPAESDAVRGKLVAADAALVVAGVASIGLAATLLWPRPEPSPPRASVALAPSPRGFVVGLGASF